MYTDVTRAMPMKTSSAKAKGRKLQQDVRDMLLEHSEGLTTDDIRSTSMGAPGEDILFSTAAREAFPWTVEVKAQEKLNVWSAYEQAEENNPGDYEPIVFFKRNRSKTFVMLDAEYFVREWRK